MIHENSGLIGLTSDGWTTSTIKGRYVNCLNVHLIDKDWRMKTILLDASDMEKRHTAPNIVQHWSRILTRFSISRIDVIGMTCDGG